ncbi:MAG: SDR family NAD(P)-dependent oxidoreductase [Acidimicrobiia bacterium]|nr:SDR family NAD(P)-dependent oxidoreductase [Acidimicrobiia bacterium]
MIEDPGHILIVGASRGIGLELVRQYAAEGWTVHATTRAIRPGPLSEVAGAVQMHLLDVRNREQLDQLVAAFPERGLDVVIHNAGIYRGFTREELMEVNAEAPIVVAQALIDAERLSPNARLVLITSGMGSRRGRTGSLGDYGDSKAALNDEFRLRARAWQLAGVIGIVMHPGWVRTDMGGSGATLAVEDSVAGMKQVIAGLATGDHGRFFNWDGSEQPW